MPIYANAQGVAKGRFKIPANVRAGTKSFEVRGSGGSFGSAVFVGEGAKVTTTMQQVITRTTTTTWWWDTDPLAQTFSVPRESMIGAVDLVVTEKGTTPIIVQIRETQVGFPTRTVLAEARLNPAQLVVDDWNRFTFPNLVHLMADTEYAIVVLADDAIASIAVAELGKWDTTTSRWVTSQPYQVGTLLSSSNARTWTAHQDRDMTFRLLAARFTQAEKVVDLGSVTLAAHSEMIVEPLTVNPANGATSELEIEMPDGSIVHAGERQVVRFNAFSSGQVNVKARLRSTPHLSASIHPGSQTILGKVSTSDEYITRAIKLDPAGSDIRVIYEALVPSGATLIPEISQNGTSGWEALTESVPPVAVGNGVFEYNLTKTGVTWPEARLRFRMTGTASSRAFVGRLRISVT